MDDSLPELGDLEREVMQLVWANGPITAEAVRERLSRPLKELTVRTVLRRLEDKGYTTHTVDGRTYVYQAAEPRGRVAAKAVQRIVDWFCNGSVEEVLVGMVDTRHARPAAAAPACRPGCEGKGEGREKMMLTILAESALRSLILGSVVWIGLNLLRVRNPHVHMTSWVMVLVASLSMPLLMHWTMVERHRRRFAGAGAGNLWPAGLAAGSPEPLGASLPSDAGMPVAARGESYAVVNWLAVATAIYAIVSPACCCCDWRSASI